jgi:hypothetical protein
LVGYESAANDADENARPASVTMIQERSIVSSWRQQSMTPPLRQGGPLDPTGLA